MGATKQKARRFIPFLVVFGITRCWAGRQPNAIDGAMCGVAHYNCVGSSLGSVAHRANGPSRVIGHTVPIIRSHRDE